MAQITWNQLATPDFKAVNALQLAAQEQSQQAIAGLGKVVTDYQAANTKKNTDAIMNALQSAKSPEEYQAALANAQAIAGTKYGDYDQEKFNAAQLTQPGVLDAQQQQQLGWADRTRNAALQAAILRGDARPELTAQYGDLQSEAGRAAGFGAITGADKDRQAAELNAQNILTAQSTVKHQANQDAIAKTDSDSKYLERVAAANAGKPVNTVTERDAQGNIISTTQAPSIGGNRPVATTYTSPAEAGTGFLNTMTNSSGESVVGSADRATVKNPESSASGYYQFTNDTWKNTLRSLPEYANKSDSEIMALKGDVPTQKIAMQKLTTDHATSLQKQGIPLTDGTLYSAHLLGLGVDQKALNVTADPSEKFTDYLSDKEVTRTNSKGVKYKTSEKKEVLRGNPQLANMTVGQYRDYTYSQAGVSNGTSPTDKSANTRIVSLPADITLPAKTKAGQALNNLNMENTVRVANDKSSDTLGNQGRYQKLLAQTQGSTIDKVLNLNSTSAKQKSLLEEIPGYNDLSYKEKIGVFTALSNWNNSDGWGSKYFNKGDTELKNEAARIIQQKVNEATPKTAARRDTIYKNIILEVRGKLGESGKYDTTNLTDADIIGQVISPYAQKEYEANLDASKQAIVNATSASPQSSKGTAPPVTVKPTVIPAPVRSGMSGILGTKIAPEPINPNSLRARNANLPNNGDVKAPTSLVPALSAIGEWFLQPVN